MESLILQRENKPTSKSGSFFKSKIQKKLSVGASNDSHEVEADSVADKVMRMASPSKTTATHTGALVQRKFTACEQEEKIQKKPLAESIQRVSNSTSEVSTAPSHVESQINSSRGGGSSMDHGTKSFMESRFGTDFSDVKIHTGSEAVQMSRELNAQAFTVGNDIYFNEGKYSPNSDSGKHLLAHELTHTVQQSGGINKKIQKIENGRGVLTNVTVNLPNTIIFTGDLGELRMSIDTVIAAGSYTLRFDQSTETLLVDNVPVDQRFNTSLVNATRTQIRNYRSYLSYLATHATPLVINPAISREPSAPSAPTDSNALPPEEAMARCNSGGFPGLKTFPFRATRFGAAMMSTWRDGNYIVVKLPMHVYSNDNFTREVNTLPTETFISGVRLAPNELVRVRIYEPHWYQLNITGSNDGDSQRTMCVTGEQMMAFGEASTTAVIMNIGLTAVDAATLFVPVGRLAQPVMRLGRAGLAATMMGVHEAAPIAIGGASSRAVTTIVEEQIAHSVGDVAIRQTVSQTIVRPLETQAVEHLGQTATAGVIRSELGTHVVDALGRTALTGTLDRLGTQAAEGVISHTITPTTILPPNPLQDMALPQLRQLALTNPEATHELLSRYLRMSSTELRLLSRRGDSMARYVIENRPTSVSIQLQELIARNAPSTNPVLQQQLSAELNAVRQASLIPRSALQSVTETRGGTIGVARTDIPGFSNRVFAGASPEAGGIPHPTFTPPSTNALFQGHAEQNLAGIIDAELQAALRAGTLTTEQLEGKTIFMRIEQEVCSICRAGLGGTATEGVLRQLSFRYPTVTFEVAAEGTSEILRFINGVLLN